MYGVFADYVQLWVSLTLLFFITLFMIEDERTLIFLGISAISSICCVQFLHYTGIVIFFS